MESVGGEEGREKVWQEGEKFRKCIGEKEERKFDKREERKCVIGGGGRRKYE